MVSLIADLTDFPLIKGGHTCFAGVQVGGQNYRSKFHSIRTQRQSELMI